MADDIEALEARIDRLYRELATTNITNSRLESDNAHLREEVKRLSSALDAEGNDANLLMLEIQRLRAAGDALAAAISALPIQRFGEGLAVINAMHDWEKTLNN